MRASMKELSKVMDTDEIAMYEGVWGQMHVEYDIFKKPMDITPYLKGLPNDRDPCPHWGIVVKGEITIIYDDKKEIAKAGEAYYYPPGHTGMAKADTEVWEFSPNDQLQKTMEVINRNMESMAKKE